MITKCLGKRELYMFCLLEKHINAVYSINSVHPRGYIWKLLQLFQNTKHVCEVSPLKD